MSRSGRNVLKAATPRGRPFANGNPGRPKGSKNRITLLAASLLEGEAEELLRTAIAIAKGGDVPMLKFLLGRLLPKERLVPIDLPPADGDFDAVDAMGQSSLPPVRGRFHQVKLRHLQAWSRFMRAPSTSLRLGRV